MEDKYFNNSLSIYEMFPLILGEYIEYCAVIEYLHLKGNTPAKWRS